MKYIQVNRIRPNPYQPRSEFDPAAIESLRASITKHGVLEPLLLRELSEGWYEIIAGERRFRASVKAGLREVPALIRKTSDAEMLELAMIENLHREDISPIDKARGFRRMIGEFGFTQRQISQVMGLSRPAVANTIRLLDLPKPIQEALHRREITEGHARAILCIKDCRSMEYALKRIVSSRMNVRETECLTKLIANSSEKGNINKLKVLNEFERSLVNELQERLGTKVNINRNGKSGRIEIEFYSEEDLLRIAESI